MKIFQLEGFRPSFFFNLWYNYSSVLGCDYMKDTLKEIIKELVLEELRIKILIFLI